MRRRDPAAAATPALVNAAEYWLAPERFARRCGRSATAFSSRCPHRPWLCLTHPDDIKRVFTRRHGVLRLGAALAKIRPHPLVLGPTGLTNVDGPEHMRSARCSCRRSAARRLPGTRRSCERKTEEALAALAVRQADPCRLPCRRSRWR